MTTPLRQQYLSVKTRYPDAIVLFRLGDFYETFDEDAKTAAKELDIVLTAREMGKGHKVPLAGIPYHALESYLGRLVRRGYKVAICEQLTDPSTSKGLVDRDVVRLVTPGTLVESSLLEHGTNNYLVAMLIDGEEAGVAYADISTSEFGTTQLPIEHLPQELARLAPAEVIFPQDSEFPDRMGVAAHMTPLIPEAFHSHRAPQRLLDHFTAKSLEAYGCHKLPLAARAAGALLEYLTQTQKQALYQLTSLHTYSVSSFMTIDPQTRRNLELFEGGRLGTHGLSLLSVLDMTSTPMGTRLLRKWLGQPLLNLSELLRRQDAVAWFYQSVLRRKAVRDALLQVSDLERLLTRVRVGTATPRDLLALRHSLEAVPSIKESLKEQGQSMSWLEQGLLPCKDVVNLIQNSIEDDASGEVGQGRTIKKGLSTKLDNLRQAAHSSREYISGLERTERQRTGIGSLKVGYNKVFGYYIEVSNTNLSRVPSDYIRRQTLTGGERFYTPELKKYESMALNAYELMEELEKTLFQQVCHQISEEAPIILRTARVVALIDVFCGLGELASRYGYVRPTLSKESLIRIKAGRHPVVERTLSPGSFVPNDIDLSTNEDQVMILTGPNMSGKSTYIRQIALTVLMAQIGAFVPAEKADIGLVDRIFTRVGLQDDLATGQSTFMVEMVETANILHHATQNSLVILDEIGRGTSTYDGLSIARAVAEHIHNDPKLGCMTLFATHYHELTELAKLLPRVRNYNVAVSEEEGRVVFLHRILPGSAAHSYGVNVAQLAGLPHSIIHRAWEILEVLESSSQSKSKSYRKRSSKPRSNTEAQLGLFGSFPLLVQELLQLDVSLMTPLEAINKLYELQQKARES